ncbi:hypothetical protein UlMin_025735 [Ulmus minor]
MHGNWDLDKLQNTFTAIDCLLIKATPIPRVPTRDRLIWTPSTSGKFSTKLAYWLDQGLRFEQKCCWDERFWKRIWNSRMLPRHKLLWWSNLLGVLPTRHHLARIFQIQDCSCLLCDDTNETSPYLLF